MDIHTIRNLPLRRERPQTSFPLKSIAAAVAFALSSGTYAAGLTDPNAPVGDQAIDPGAQGGKPTIVSNAAAKESATAPAQVRQWTIVPSVGVNETYTDNVRLAPGPLAKSDFVTEIMPAVSVVGMGRYLKADANFSMQEIGYAEKNAPATFATQLHADANAKLIENLLFLDGTASVSQQNISALGAQPTDNIYATGNRTNVRTYNISPYLRHAFDTFATSELRYSYGSVAADAGGLSTSHSDTTSFNVNSGPAFRIVGLGLQYNDQIIHYPAAANVDLQTISGNASYLIVPDLKLTATAGYDHNDYATLGGATKGYFWTTGFSWAVSQRTSLAVTAGHRYYGDTYAVNAATRTRTSIWSLGYNESVTTAQSQFGLPTAIDTSSYLNQLYSGTISDPTQRGQAVNNTIQNFGLPGSLANSANYFTNAVFLQKQLQASVALTSPKTTLVLSLYDTLRDPLSAQQDIGIPPANAKTNQLGASAVLGRRLTAQTRANVSLLASRINSVSVGQVEYDETLKLGLTKQFSRKVMGTVEIRRNQQESSQPGLGYRENAIAAFFNIRL